MGVRLVRFDFEEVKFFIPTLAVTPKFVNLREGCYLKCHPGRKRLLVRFFCRESGFDRDEILGSAIELDKTYWDDERFGTR